MKDWSRRAKVSIEASEADELASRHWAVIGCKRRLKRAVSAWCEHVHRRVTDQARVVATNEYRDDFRFTKALARWHHFAAARKRRRMRTVLRFRFKIWRALHQV